MATQERTGFTVRGRNLPYLASRLRSVGTRYGLTPRKARDRVRRCVRLVGRYGVRPTFATPGRVIDADPGFFRELTAEGVELAVHGYDHVNFHSLTKQEASEEFARALRAYSRHGIPCDGFRCPYLSYSPELADVLPEGSFLYGSNRAIAWTTEALDSENPVFRQLATFYAATSADHEPSVPTATRRLVEIPASVPDDLEFCDALGLGEDGLLEAWLQTFERVHRRGELFAPLFHPESFDLLAAPMEGLLEDMKRRRPAVWLTQLRDVARWWREREAFRVTISREQDGLCVRFACSKRATVLARDWPVNGGGSAWDDRWAVLDGRNVRVEEGARPFVGVRALEPETVAFLEEQGYVVDRTEEAPRCTVFVEPGVLGRLPSKVALIAYIEASSGPLLKLGRWPDAAKSAFCLAGDLDALSLRDYAGRLAWW
jgi:Polysaccharide deacetylase